MYSEHFNESLKLVEASREKNIALEAMEMENDICAPADGTVASVEVAQGATVETDAVLVTLN